MAQTNRTRASDPAGRVRRSRAAGLALVREWRSSGQTPAQFCRAHGIGVHRLHYWKRKEDVEKATDLSVPGEFFALSVPARAEGSERERGEAEVAIEIRAMDQIIVRVPVAAGSSIFAQTLRGVLEVLAS
jgi:transposase-like protein